eukprot:126557_1
MVTVITTDWELIIWIFLITIAYAICILQLYSIYQFKTILYLLIIQKRYPVLIIVEALAVIIWLLLTPLGFIFTSTIAIMMYIYPALYQFIICTEVTRLWLVSYDLHYLNSSNNQQWKSQIDQNFADKDWYFRNRNKYGNRKYIITRAFCYYLCVACITTSILIVSIHIGQLIEYFFFFVHVCTTVLIYYKCRLYKQLKDNFLFYYEFRITVIIWTTEIFLALLSLSIMMIGFRNIG